MEFFEMETQEWGRVRDTILMEVFKYDLFQDDGEFIPNNVFSLFCNYMGISDDDLPSRVVYDDRGIAIKSVYNLRVLDVNKLLLCRLKYEF